MDGVAHIRISTSPCEVDGDFYAVFVGGRMDPIKFESWSMAYGHYTLLAKKRESRLEVA